MTREECYGALFALLSSLQGAPFRLISRKLQPLDDVAGVQMPALFLTVDRQMVVVRPGLPPRRTLRASVFLYVSSPDPNVASGTLINPLIDLVETTLAPFPSLPQQTLGGVVQHAWIEGTIDVYEAVKTQRAAALIPITMLMP
jgi:hypothetical protein